MENSISVDALFSKYLAWCKTNRSPRSLEWYENYISKFLRHLGDNTAIPALELKPYHIVEWIDSEGTEWGDNYKGGAIIAIKRIYNWAEELGYVDSNPVKKLKKPQSKRRESHMTPVDFQRLVGCLSSDDPFREFITFMWHTGCRPQEARHIEPRHVDLERKCVIIPKEEAKGKRKARIIHLNDTALAIIQRGMESTLSAKVLNNSRGKPWTKYSICNRMYRLSKLIDRKLCSYDCRHGWATRKLIQGYDHLTIAALMGHTDGSMLAKVYSHIETNDAHLRLALAD